MTFDTQSDGSVHANGTNDTTVTNSSVFDDLLAAFPTNSFINMTHKHSVNSNLDIKQMIFSINKLVNNGTLNITVPSGMSAHFIVDGGSTFTSDELQNYGNMKWKGFVQNNDPLNSSSYNLIVETARLSTSPFAQSQGAIDLRGITNEFEDMILRIGNPIDSYSSLNSIVNLTRVWLQPISRLNSELTGSGSSNAYWRYRQGGTFDNVIISTPITFYRAPAVSINPTLLSLGNTLFAGYCGLDRYGISTDRIIIQGLKIIGNASIQSLGSPIIEVNNSSDGTETAVTSVGFNHEKRSGVHFNQDVQFYVTDSTGVPIEGMVIREKETQSETQAPSLLVCVNNDPREYDEYDDTTRDNRVNTYESDASGFTNVIKRRQGILSWNYDGNENFDSNLPTGVFLDNKTVDTKNNIQPGSYGIGHKINFGLEQIRRLGETLIIPASVIEIPGFTNSETDIASFNFIETSNQLFERLRYWEKTNPEIVNYIGIGETLIDYVDNVITIRDGWDFVIRSESSSEPITVDNATKTITAYTTNDKFTITGKLVVNGKFVRHTNVDGLFTAIDDIGNPETQIQIKPNSSLSAETKFSFDVINESNNEVIESHHDLTGSPDFYIVLDNRYKIDIHVYGTGVFDHIVSYGELDNALYVFPDLLNFELSVDPTTANTTGWLEKIENGDWTATLTSSTISFGGTETLENIHAGLLRYLIDYSVTEYNKTNPTNRLHTDDYINDTGLVVTVKKEITDFNSLKITTGTTELILNDANADDLITDFGVPTTTSLKFAGRHENLEIGDVIGIELNGVLQPLVTKIDTNPQITVFNKADTVITKVKRNRFDSVHQTLTASNSIYYTQFNNIVGLSSVGVANERTISDYVSIDNQKIIVLKDFPTTLNTSIENEKDYAFWSALDLTFSFGVEGKHIINYISENVCVLNYELDTPDETLSTVHTTYYKNAGVSNGKNPDGSTHYQEYIIQNVGGNHEYFEIHLHHVENTRSYNTAGALFHTTFATNNVEHNFYIVKLNGETVLFTAYVTAKLGTVWQMNRGTFGHNLSNNEHITFEDNTSTIEYQARKKFRVGAPITIIKNDILETITPNITWLPQKQIVVNIPTEVTEGLEDIPNIKATVENNNALNQDIIDDIGENKYQIRNVYNVVTRHDNASTKAVINNLEIDVSASIPTIVRKRFMAVINIPEDAQDVTYIARIQQAVNNDTIGTGNIYMRMRPITSSFDPDTNYYNDITVGDIIREADTYNVERLPKIKDDLYQVEGKFSVIGLTGWHIVGIELDIVDGDTTVNLEAFGINPIENPDAIGGLFYTTNSGNDIYAPGNPYEIKLSYTIDLSTVNNKLDTIDTSVSNIPNYTQKLDELKTQISSLPEADLSTLETNVNEIKATVNSNSTKIDNIPTVDLSPLSNSISEVKTKVYDTNTKVTAIPVYTTKLNEIEDKIDNLPETNLAILESDVSEIKTIVGENKSAIGNIPTVVYTQKLDDLKDQINALPEADLSTLETSVSDIKTIVDANKVRLDAIPTTVYTTRFDDIEADTTITRKYLTNNKEYDENGGELTVTTLDDDNVTVYRIDKDIAEDDKRKRKKQ